VALVGTLDGRSTRALRVLVLRDPTLDHARLFRVPKALTARASSIPDVNRSEELVSTQDRFQVNKI